MRIALTADPELPVPPIHYGGIERIVHLLAEGLVARGHEVTLIAHPDSNTSAKLVPYRSSDWNSRMGKLANIALVFRTIAPEKFDIIHSHSRLAYLLPTLGMRIPKLMSYQRKITPRSVVWARRLAGDTIEFSAVSHAMLEEVQHLAPWHVVYNGVPTATYTFRAEVEQNAPLVFLGRIEPIKGAHLAIEIAQRSGTPLVIAGNIPGEHQEYFQSQIAPHLDGTFISYVGPVNDAEKNSLLGCARAFLMPILWEEPFGIVMAEALACGTPVIGLNRGSVPEVLSDGVTGLVCSDVNEMVQAVGRVDQLDRAACRARAAAMFSEDTVVEGFLEIYRRLLAARSERLGQSSWGKK
jgi:glycosyltransferase involved in cell wall biosynthesis